MTLFRSETENNIAMVEQLYQKSPHLRLDNFLWIHSVYKQTQLFNQLKETKDKSEPQKYGRETSDVVILGDSLLKFA
jgi:hypothetical protein